MDARLKELDLLARVDREGSIQIGPLHGQDRDLVAFLASERYVNDLQINWEYKGGRTGGMPGETELERLLHQERIDGLSKILGGHSVTLRITHAGRVRMAELSWALRSERIRDRFGILWDGRHFHRDLRIQLLDASADLPVFVAYLDLNGMGTVNDTFGHDAGNVVLRAYFEAITSIITGRGEAYRVGGDEVCIIFHSPRAESVNMIRQICLLFMRERLRYEDKDLGKLSIAIGAVISSDVGVEPEQLEKVAEKSMYRAKQRTDGMDSRPSSLALDGEDTIELFPTNASGDPQIDSRKS